MDRKQRIEENEKLFREVNERVEQMQATFQSGPDPEWVCECGHEKVDVERVVKQQNGYYVVEKDGV
jgi:hypothetical protein